jgi:ATP-dependent DNA helicase RecG
MRETLHNAIAHSDYGKRWRIIVLEYNNRLIFENAGGFIPYSVEEVIHLDRPQPYYRNPFLLEAMVNLNMIDTIGSGIKRMFTIQKDRFFPLPTYNISGESKTEVTIHGELINENYSRQLFLHPELSLDDVIALDKVQKKMELTENEVERLRELKLVAGVASDLQILGIYPKISYKEYKEMVLNLIKSKGSATRAEVENLIMPTLSPEIPLVKRQKKISNILLKLSTTDGKINNISSSVKYSVWELVSNDIKSSNKNKK